MKKILLVTLMITMLAAAPVLAEEGTTVSAVQMDWNQQIIDAFVADGFDGAFGTVTLHDGTQFRMLIPDGFQQRDLTEEDQAQNVALAVANESTASEILVRDNVLEGVGSIGELAQSMVAEDPMTAISFAVINGTTAVISGREADDFVTVSFDLGESRFVQIDLKPLSGNNKLANYFMASIQFDR